MIAGARVLAVITARGGSKGLPGKNIRPLAGRPLIGWTIEAAHQSSLIDRTVLSTDDEAIAVVARQCNCDVPFMRAPALAADDSSSMDVMLDALDRVPGYDIAVLLQPTSPLRTAQDIDNAIRACISSGAPGCVSVCEAEESPYWMYVLDAEARMRPLLPDLNNARRRQDLPPVHVLNGAVYVSRVDVLRQERAFVVAGTVAYPMTRERSADIDTEQDLLIAEQYLTGQAK
ncbi:MAG TPA: acylneuraminate cytidylyltransferase family protein [Steroidobacter sp.]